MADYLGKKIKFNIEDNDLQKIRFNKVYGESQQATRSGKNLFDKDNANIINTYIAGSGNGVLPSESKDSKKPVSQSTSLENKIRKQNFDLCIASGKSRSYCYYLYY